jgi:hypothetical protein
MFHPESIVRRADTVLFARVQDEMFAIDEEAGYCYALNDVAGRIWELIENPTPVSSVCSHLRNEFNVDEDACLRDVLDVLSKLKESGLVEEVE